MSDTSVVVTFALIVLVALIVGLWYMVRLWNSPDGERYRRRGMQGPFVPFSEEDIAAEKRRTNERLNN